MKNPRRKKEHGQALAEFALVLPIILLIFTGIIDFGRMMYMYSQLSNAVREGARYGSVTGPNSASPQFGNCTGIKNAIDEAMTIPIPDEDLTIEITYDDGKDLRAINCNTAATITTNSIVLGDRIRVMARAEFDFVTPIVSSFGPMELQVTAARTILRGGTQVIGDD